MQDLKNGETNEKIRAVIFDFGNVYNLGSGPVTIFMKQFKRTERADKRKLWNAEVKPVWRRLTKGEITTKEFWAHTAEAFSMAIDPAEMDRKMIYGQVYPGFRNGRLIGIINKLKENGKTIAMLTNNVKEWFDEWKKKDENCKLFDPIIASQDIGMRKPDEEIYLHTFKVLGLAPEECFFIDDQPENVAVGEKLGMLGFVFPPKNEILHANWTLKQKLEEIGLLTDI